MAEQEPTSSVRRPSRAPLIIALIAAFAGLLLVCIFSFLIYCQSAGGRCQGILRSQPLPTPTPFVQAPPSPTEEPIAIELDEGQTLSITLSAPTALSVKGESFAVQRVPIGADGVWNPQLNSENVAAWLGSSYINYVFGVRDTEANRRLLQSLELNDPIVLTTANGERIFEFSSREIVPLTQRDVFFQNLPGVTLVLTRGDDTPDRLVVQGRFVVEEAASQVAPAPSGSAEAGVAEIGEVVQLGELQLAVTLFDTRPNPADNSLAYYLVDYQVQNNGNGPFDTDLLQMALVDGIGTQYALSLDASQLGNHAPLQALLEVGQLVQATAGYVIPRGVDPNELGWVVRRNDTGETVEIRVAAPAPAGESPADKADISLDDVTLSPDATQLFLQGKVTNNGGGALVVTSDDILFSSEGAVYFLLSTSPSFPWVVNPGQTIPYVLAVQRPVFSDSAILSILGRSWELTDFR